jgi:predicted kinase
MEISKRQLQDEEVTAYHGGPHSFDKFSTQYMGTGEGKQAFGWGLYFTDLEDIAKYYAETIGNDNTKILGEINDLFFQTFGLEINHQLGYARLVHETIDEIKSGDIGIMRGMIRLKNASIKMRQFDDTKIGQFFNKVLDLERQKKYIYKVTLHKGKSPEQYNWLEWYKKPNKEQVRYLLSKLNKEQLDRGFYYGLAPDATNADLYKGLSNALGSDKEASLFLLRVGIDGIKYPTGSLVIKMKTDDTDGFNYVVFDENAVNIEKQTQLEGMEITKGELEEEKKARTKLRKKSKGDRCTRIAKRKYDVWPSAYSSGAVVRCRQGKIWKGLKEEEDETLDEKWSEKYKKSIDCNNPKGFSQKAHCKGRLKEEESNIDKRKIYVLVGPPSVGKSTWIKNTFSDIQPYIISRDDIVEQIADNLGWTYDDLFVVPPEGSKLGDYDKKYGKVIQSPRLSFSKVLEANNKVQVLLTKRFSNAVNSGKDIVVDMTNMTAGARKNALKAIQGSENLFEKIAVVFPFEGAEEIIIDVARKRAEAAERMGKSKTLPDSVMRNMFASFQKVTPDEGFDKVIQQDNRELLSTLTEKTDFSKEKEQGLHGWFARQGGKGKSKGWVDCNTCRDGKCKSCGRKEGEKRSKYPACRPTPSACKSKGRGDSWGKKS